MTVALRPDPFLTADNPALDFLNSICAPWGEDIEWIENGDDLCLDNHSIDEIVNHEWFKKIEKAREKRAYKKNTARKRRKTQRKS